MEQAQEWNQRKTDLAQEWKQVQELKKKNQRNDSDSTVIIL